MQNPTGPSLAPNQPAGQMTTAIQTNIAVGHVFGYCPQHGASTAQHIADTEDGRKVWYCHAEDSGDPSGHDSTVWQPLARQPVRSVTS